MKLSQLKNKVDSALDECGDIDVVVCTEVDGLFCVEMDRNVDVIEFPDEDNRLTGPVFAILNMDDLPEDETERELKLVIKK